MKVVVTGDRDHDDRAFIFAKLDELHSATPIELLVHGACGRDADHPDEETLRGADEIADDWASERGVPVRRFAARWSHFGGKAGPIRNGVMLDEVKPDIVLAFPLAKSRGTWNCVSKARARGIPTLICQR